MGYKVLRTESAERDLDEIISYLVEKLNAQAEKLGVQILLIMAFHYTEDLSNAADHFNGPAQVFYDYIGSSGVDMFLF